MPEDCPYVAVRLDGNPIISPATPGLERGDKNINGPSLIRVPDWVDKPLGKYYLYFANHGGRYIRLAYADKLTGPWKIHRGGVLNVRQGPGQEHIASPDVHVDDDARQIRMYFHQPAAKDSALKGQVSFASTSPDGLAFAPKPEPLGSYYFRVFRYGGWHYALAKNGNKDGILSRSRDGLTGFETGPSILPRVRHTAMWLEGDTLWLVYTIVGEAPEQIYLSTMHLAGDWRNWKPSPGWKLLAPETEYEGADLPLKPSSFGGIGGPVRQLRDPAIFREDNRIYLLYSIAGEQGLAIAELKRKQTRHAAPSDDRAEESPPPPAASRRP